MCIYWSYLKVHLSCQSELDYSGEDHSMSPRPPQNQHSQPMLFPNSGFPVSSGSIGVAAPGHDVRLHHDPQSKNYVFSNALSSPVRQSLQNYQVAQGGYFSNNVQLSIGARNNETNLHHQNGDSNSYNSADAAMDMHSDSPGHDFTCWSNLYIECFGSCFLSCRGIQAASSGWLIVVCSSCCQGENAVIELGVWFRDWKVRSCWLVNHHSVDMLLT